MPYLARPVRAVRIIKSRAPIVEAVKTVAARLSATEEEAWRAIKSQCAAGLLTLEGIDEKGQPRTVERHWIIYIEKFGLDLPSGAHFESDMPDRDSGSMVAFDRHRAQRDRLSDEADGAQPRSLPPRRLHDLVADGAQLDKLCSQAERDLKTEDWSLGNVAARRHDADTTGPGDLRSEYQRPSPLWGGPLVAGEGRPKTAGVRFLRRGVGACYAGSFCVNARQTCWKFPHGIFAARPSRRASPRG
jgi:hypothetical protein